MTTMTIGYGAFRSPEWLDTMKLKPGQKKTYENLAMASRGKDRAYPSHQWLADKANVTTRTIRNHLDGLIDKKLIDERLERILGRLRKVYYFLEHPVIEESKRKNFPVTPEKTSGHLYKKKKNIKIPPSPPRSEAADAAQQREKTNEQYDSKNTSRRQSPKVPHQFFAGVDSIDENPVGRVVSGERADATGSGPRDISRCPDGGFGQSLIEDPRWKTAQEFLYQKYPDHILWWKPIFGLRTKSGLQLDCPDQYFHVWVKDKLSSQITESLQQVGISEFSLSFGEKEKLLQGKKNQAQQQHQEAEDACLLRLSPRQQFEVLLQAYPRKSAYGGDYFAWMTFERMQKRGKLPEITTLLQILRTHKASADWNRDSGRWIPGLNKWLRARLRWEKIDGEKR